MSVKHRHNIVRDTLYDACVRSGVSAGKEIDVGLGSDTGALRPADLLLILGIAVEMFVWT